MLTLGGDGWVSVVIWKHEMLNVGISYASSAIQSI